METSFIVKRFPTIGKWRILSQPFVEWVRCHVVLPGTASAQPSCHFSSGAGTKFSEFFPRHRQIGTGRVLVLIIVGK